MSVSLSLQQVRENFIRSFGKIGPLNDAPPSVGQVLSLLIFDGGERSSAYIAQELKLSRGAVSQAVQLLEAHEIVQRSTKDGDRRDYFRFNQHSIDAVIARMTSLWTRARQDIEVTLQEACATQEPLPENFVIRMQALSEFYAGFERYFKEVSAFHLTGSTPSGVNNTNEREIDGDTN